MSRLALLVFTKAGLQGSAACGFRWDVSHLLVVPKRARKAEEPRPTEGLDVWQGPPAAGTPWTGLSLSRHPSGELLVGELLAATPAAPGFALYL